MLLNNKFSVVVGSVILLTPFFSSFQIKKMFYIIAFFCMLYIFKKGKFEKIHLSETALFCFSSLSSLSVLWSGISYLDSLTLFIEYSGIFLIFVLVFRCSFTKVGWKILAYLFLIGCIVTSLYIFRNWRYGIEFFDNGRFSVDDVNNNYIAYTLATAFPVLMIIYWENKKKTIIINCLCLIVSCVFGLGILLTASRGAFLAFLLCVLVVCIKEIYEKPIVGFFLTTTSLSLYLFFYSLLPWFIQERLNIFGSGGMEDVSSGRFELWSLAIDLFKEAPFFGSGAGSFIYRSSGMQVHNIFFSVVCEFGLLGLILYLLPIFLVLFSLFKRENPSWAKYGGILLLLTWGTIAFTGVWQYAPVAWFAFAWVYRIPDFNNTCESLTQS